MKLFKKKPKDEDSKNAESKSGAAGAPAPNPIKGAAGLTPVRVVFGVIAVFILLWLVGAIISFFEPSVSTHVARNEKITEFVENHSADEIGEGATGTDGALNERGDRTDASGAGSGDHKSPSASRASDSRDHSSAASRNSKASTPKNARGGASHSSTAAVSGAQTRAATPADSKDSKNQSHSPAKNKADSPKSSGAHDEDAPKAETSRTSSEAAHGAEDMAEHGAAALKIPRKPGVATTESIIKPLEYELEERWWGWRPNDVINITDNVNNFQLGVLEVTRRATVALAERLSRTGSTASYDLSLERAMNWFMVKAEAYWFPSSESKYKEGLDELRAYKARLEKGQGQFFTRPDNLIPLLASFEDLLGSCDENLVKTLEEDGSPVSSSRADDYFYYTQGVASSMVGILEAINEDFHTTLETRRSAEILHHAISSCHHAIEIHPWLILESDLDSIFANHRANVAAPISHARFYLGLLIKALST